MVINSGFFVFFLICTSLNSIYVKACSFLKKLLWDLVRLFVKSMWKLLVLFSTGFCISFTLDVDIV